MLASCVEKPPSPIAEKAWHTASSQFIPASFSAAMQVKVIVTYTTQRLRAVSAMRGVNAVSFIGPGVSALNNWPMLTKMEAQVNRLTNQKHIFDRFYRVRDAHDKA